LLAVGTVQPIFLEDGINSKCHEDNSGRQLYSFKQGMAKELNEMFLQQDGSIATAP
jgi:hypothetical protein